MGEFVSEPGDIDRKVRGVVEHRALPDAALRRVRLAGEGLPEVFTGAPIVRKADT